MAVGEPADILLTDVKMPLMNGIELLEQASGLYPEMKKLIFSGYGEFEYAQQAMRYGVEEYILKPVDPEEFRKAMDKLFDALDREREAEEREGGGGKLLSEVCAERGHKRHGYGRAEAADHRIFPGLPG